MTNEDEDDEDFKTNIMRLRAPRNLMENRLSVRFILMSTVKKAYDQMIKDKMMTKEQIADNMKENPVVLDALMESVDLWSIDMMADVLWGMDLNIAGIMLGFSQETDEDEEDEEEDENERIH